MMALRGIFAAPLLFAGMICLGFARVGAADAQQSTLQGIVTAAGTGQPLEGAIASLAAEGMQVRATLTDRNGFFPVTGIDPGTYTLRVNFVGYVTASEPVVLAAGEERTLGVGGPVTGCDDICRCRFEEPGEDC